MLDFIYLVLLISFIGLIYTYYIIWKEKSERLKVLSLKNKELENARLKMNISKNEMYNQIDHFFGREILQNVQEQKIWQGMQDYLLIASLGNPEDRKESVYKDKIYDDYFYYGQHNRLGNIKYSLQVILENKVVVGWKDLK